VVSDSTATVIGAMIMQEWRRHFRGEPYTKTKTDLP